MENAYHIASGKTVSVKEVEYKDYYGGFLCCNCKKTVYLRKKYTRSDGVKVRAAFVHPEAEQSELCPLRVEATNSAKILSASEPISRGQNFELLQKYFVFILNFVVVDSHFSPWIWHGDKEIKIADIRYDGLKSYWMRDYELQKNKRFYGEITKNTNKVLKNKFNYSMLRWNEDRINDFLKITTQFFKISLERQYHVNKTWTLQYFLENQNKWRGIGIKSKQLKISKEKLINSHFSRINGIYDFIMSTDELTIEIAVGLAFVKYFKNTYLNIDIINWLEYQCTKDFLKAAEDLLTNQKRLNDLFKSVQQNKVTPRFEKIIYLVYLTLEAMENLIKYIDWEIVLQSLVESVEN